MPKPVRARWAPKRRRRQPTSPGEVQDGTVDDGSFVQAAEAAVASETEEMTHWAEPKVKMDYFQKMTSTTRERYGQDRYHAGSNTVLVRTTLHTHIQRK